MCEKPWNTHTHQFKTYRPGLCSMFFNGHWSWTIGPTMRWFQWIAHLYKAMIGLGSDKNCLTLEIRFPSASAISVAPWPKWCHTSFWSCIWYFWVSTEHLVFRVKVYLVFAGGGSAYCIWGMHCICRTAGKPVQLKHSTTGTLFLCHCSVIPGNAKVIAISCRHPPHPCLLCLEVINFCKRMIKVNFYTDKVRLALDWPISPLSLCSRYNSQKKCTADTPEN